MATLLFYRAHIKAPFYGNFLSFATSNTFTKASLSPVMGDTTSFSLPPGTQFYPSDQQLICYYLSSKNGSDHRNGAGLDLIREIDLYNCDPFNLPESACFRFGRGGRKSHWFCFVARVLKGGRRKAGGGYWKKRGRVKDVVGAGARRVVVGTRKRFVFYLGDCTETAVKTDWLMYEYALTGQPMVHSAIQSFLNPFFGICLCSIYARCRHAFCVPFYRFQVGFFLICIVISLSLE